MNTTYHLVWWGQNEIKHSKSSSNSTIIMALKASEGKASCHPPNQGASGWHKPSVPSFKWSTLAIGYHRSSRGRFILHGLSSTHSTRQHIEAHLSFSQGLPHGPTWDQQTTQRPRALAVHVVLECPLLHSWRRVCLCTLVLQCGSRLWALSASLPLSALSPLCPTRDTGRLLSLPFPQGGPLFPSYNRISTSSLEP